MQSKNSVITWVVILVIILAGVGAFFLTRKTSTEEMKANNNQDVSKMVEVSGATAQMFEGQNLLSYKFYVPSGMTSTKGDDSQTVVIKGADDSQKALVYFSYEGARGWSPEDYFRTIISPKVPVLKATSTLHVGSYDWYNVTTETMEWNIAKIKGGEWLMLVESKKADSEVSQSIFSTLKAE